VKDAAMNNRRFQECVAIVLKHEGGFVERSDDPGGATNMGITLRTLCEWRGDDSLTANDLRTLTEAEAREIYFARYWNPIRGDELPPGLDLAVFDWAVHGGVSRAARDLQAVLGVKVDGAIGRQTIEVARRADRHDLIRWLCERRLNYLRSRPHWSIFGRGWERRVMAIEAAALERAKNPALTAEEAQRTSTVQTATGVAAAIAPAGAALPQLVSAFSGLDRWVGLGLIAIGLVTLIVAAWLASTWIRMHRS
jgi:lysozyme family protein